MLCTVVVDDPIIVKNNRLRGKNRLIGSSSIYIFAIIKRNHFKMYMFGVMGETHAHDYFKVISFYNRNDI